MIDTVRLRLIVDNIQPIFENRQAFIKGVGHISRVVHQNWIVDIPKSHSNEYLPKVSFRYWSSDSESKKRLYALYIELSLPRLVYGHNLYELSDDDFEQVVKLLINAIEVATSLKFSFDDISSAVVTRIDYGKNIVSDIPGFTHDVLDIMSKQNISRRFDVTKQDYFSVDNRVDDGHGVRYHTKNYEFILYDKYVDMQKEGVGISRAFNNYPTPERSKLKKMFETNELSILRLEARFNGGVKRIKQMLKSVGNTRDPTLQNLFDVSLAKDVVSREWNKYTKYIAMAELDQNELYEITCNALKANINHHKFFEALGIQTLVDKIGIRNFRTMLDTYNLADSWRATKRLLESIPKARYESIQVVDNAIQEFEPIKDLKNYIKKC